MFIINRTDFTEAKLILPEPQVLLKYATEKEAIEKNYSFFTCKITSRGLICEGKFSVSEAFTNYDVRIIYNAYQHPKVFVLTPKIEYNPDIHMYKDSSLCLYYPKDNSWGRESMLYNTIIPWTSEWLVFYELYKLKGKWLGRYKKHS